MTFRQLATNNVKGGFHRYSAYFLSCAFSVLVFYVFASFITNPIVQTGYIVKGGRAGVNAGLASSEVIILIFSFLFVLYSTTAFLRSRKKEFGLLTLMGMTQKQLRRMVFFESMTIAGMAMLVGLGLGILVSKLFLMAMGALLQVANPIPFMVPPLALAGTLLVFSVMFVTLTALSLLGVRQSSIRELLKANKQARLAPKFRPVMFILGLALLISGYTLAWNTDGSAFVRNTFPILGLTISGTYLLVVHGSVAVTKMLQSRRPVLWRGTNVVTINRIVFRLRDNARIIFISAILIAVVCSALGAFNTLLQNAHSWATDNFPFAVSLEALDSNKNPQATAEQVRLLIATETDKQVVMQQFIGLRATIPVQNQSRPVLVLDYSAYKQARLSVPTLPEVALESAEALLLQPYPVIEDQRLPSGTVVSTNAGELTLQDIQVANHVLFSGRLWLIVPDEDYRDLAQGLGKEQIARFYGYQFTGWEKAHSLPEQLDAAVSRELGVAHARVAMYDEARQMAALTMFIGVFVSFLFFIATGSLLYFKLFTEVEDDRRQFNILREVGTTRREMLRIVNREVGAIFFLPVLIGSVHAGFALKTLSNMIRMDIIVAGLMVAGTYLILQIGYFFLARGAYLKQMLARG